MPLLLRALRWRAAASVATALLAAVTVLGAVVGPLWTRAGTESILRDALVAKGPTQNAAIFMSQTSPTSFALAALLDTARAAPLPHYGPPIEGLRVLSDTHIPGGSYRLRTALLWRQGFCDQIVVLTGRCPTAAGEVMLHRFASSRLQEGVGAVLQSAVQGLSDVSPTQPTTEKVVGTYLPKDPTASFWAGDGDTAFINAVANSNDPSDSKPDRAAATLTVPATFEQLSRQADINSPVNGFVTVTRVLDVDSVRLKDIPALRKAIDAAATASVYRSTQSQAVTLQANVVFQFDQAQVDGKTLGRASTIVLAQLVLLAAVVLLLVLNASGTARAPEIAAGRLRGLRTRTVAGLALGEPLLLVAVGTPLGAVLAYGVARGMAAQRLVPGTPVVFGAGAFEALGIALLALLVAVVLVCGRALGKPVLTLWQRTDKPPSRFALALELIAAVGLAAAAVGTTQSAQPWVLLTPVPVSLAVALLGLRLLPLLFLPTVRRTRARRRVASFLAVRQLVRRREGSWLTGLLVVAFGLAATATASYSVATRAAETRGAAEVGAPVVLLVQPDAAHPDVDLRAAVRTADPSGRKAMAVIEYLPFANDPGGRLLVLDTTRMAAVMNWDERVFGSSEQSVVAALQAPTGTFPNVVVTRSVRQDPISLGNTGTVPGGGIVTDISGVTRKVRFSEVVKELPRGLDAGTLADWSLVGTQQNGGVAGLFEVWMTSADPTILRSLAQQGVQVLSSETTAGRTAVLKRQGPGLAVLLSLVAAGIALVLAAATTLFSVLTSARRRGWELAALASMGVPERTLRRSSRRESMLLLSVGLVLGAVAGVIACVATLTSIPFFSDSTPVPVLLVPQAPPLLVLLAVAVLLVLLTSTLVSRTLHRAADPAQLREVQA